MRVTTMQGRFVLLGLLLWLTSCGGGSGGSVAEGGIGGTGISTGPITGFGSIFVNGVEYDTRDADVLVEGELAGSGDAAVLNYLAVGKVVTVVSDVPSGTRATATQVSFNDNVEGPLQSIAVVGPGVLELVVLGQTVVTDAATQFEDTTAATLALGDLLEVSGLVQPDGTIRATFVDKKGDNFVAGDVEVSGTVSNLDVAARTFTVSAVLVDYASADLSELDGPLADGAEVEVRGSFGGGVLTALEVDSEDDPTDGTSTSWLELQGYIASVVAPDEFVLDGVAVRITADTELGGGTTADVVAGARVEVQGRYSGNILTASQIEFHD